MAAFGDLAPFGLLAFGSTPSTAEPIYASMVDGVKGGFSVAQGGHVEACIYADALAFAAARMTVRHGFDQRRPMRAVEFLPAHERTYGLAPGPYETLHQRRLNVAVRKKISRGSRREHMENLLSTMLGNKFVALVTETGTPSTHPASPGDVGAWDAPSTLPLFFRILSPIAVVGSAAVAFTYENILGDGARMTPLMRLCVEPEKQSRTEAVTITSAPETGPLVAVATFLKSHDAGCIARSHAPVWQSSQRNFLVVLTSSAATDPLVIRRVDELMRRLVRGTSRWAIAVESSPGTLGPYTIGLSPIGVTPVGTIVL